MTGMKGFLPGLQEQWHRVGYGWPWGHFPAAVAMIMMPRRGNGRRDRRHQVVEGLGHQVKASVLNSLQVCDLRRRDHSDPRRRNQGP